MFSKPHLGYAFVVLAFLGVIIMSATKCQHSTHNSTNGRKIEQESSSPTAVFGFNDYTLDPEESHGYQYFGVRQVVEGDRQPDFVAYCDDEYLKIIFNDFLRTVSSGKASSRVAWFDPPLTIYHLRPEDNLDSLDFAEKLSGVRFIQFFDKEYEP